MRIPLIHQRSLWIASVAILLLSTSLEFYARACGFLLTPDSLQYLSASISFKTNGSFLGPDGSYYSYWPPLFPIILSFFRQPQEALIGINVACKVILLLALVRLSTSLVADPFLRIIFLMASLVGVHVIMISIFVWSELIFMTFIFLNAHCALQLKKNKSYFYWLLVTGFLACLQRNAGLFWISGVCLWLSLDRAVPLKSRVWDSGICFFVSTSGMWGWNIFNTFFLSSDFSFYRHDFFAYFFSNFKSILSTFGKTIIPLNGTPAMFCGVLFFVAVFVGLASKIKADRHFQFLVIVLSAYSLGFLIMPGHLNVFDMDRYFSVMTPIVYLFVIVLVQEKTQSARRATRVLIYLVVLIWLGYPLWRSVKNTLAWHEQSCASTTAGN